MVHSDNRLRQCAIIIESHRVRLGAQFKALDLGGRGLRQFAAELDPAQANELTNKKPRPKPGLFFLPRGALLLLAALLAALSGLLIRLLIRLLGLLTGLLLAATLLATTLVALLVLLAALILIILSHRYLQFFVKYCLNVIIQPTHFS
jgi:hypothetical protein